jgi:threonine/homoserine efflux transporter RhtA
MINSKFIEKYNIPLIATVLAGIGILVPIYLGYKSDSLLSRSFSVSMAMLFAGMIVESLRIAKSWKSISLIFVGAYLFSLFTFLSIDNKSTYNIDILIDALPFMFILH